MGIAFVPVVLIETGVVRGPLGLAYGMALKGMALANVVTALLGVPLAWLVVLVLELVTTVGRAFGVASPVQMLVAVTLQAAWLVPYEDELFWMIPAAATFLLIPCYGLSVII